MKQHIIWHISDIHIRNGVHVDIIYAIDQLVSNIKKSQIPFDDQLVLVAGDVFENKNRVSQYDLKCFYEILNKLNFIKILIIPGNHDYSHNSIVENNKDDYSNLDLISAALIGNSDNEKANIKNVYMFKDTGIKKIHKFEHINFCILSPMDNENIQINTQMDGVNIAILHEPIKGCNLYGSTVVENARFSIGDLEVYDAVMAGDIHKPQFMGSRKQMAYCGSLIQKNKGEDIKHGCVKWQFTINPSDPRKIKYIFNKTLTQEFIPFKLNRAFVRVLAINDKIKYPEIELINKVEFLEFRYKNCSEPVLNNFIYSINFKFGKINEINNVSDYGVNAPNTQDIIMRNLLTQQTFTKEIESVILSPSQNDPNKNDQVNKLEQKESLDLLLNPDENLFSIIESFPNQVELIKEAVSGFIYAEDVVNLHIKLHDKISDQLGSIKYKWKLNYLYWSNIFCYGEDNFIDFTNLKGVNSLIGKNRTGKSSIIDILIFILYNELLRGDRKSVVNTGALKYKIACSFTLLDFSDSNVNLESEKPKETEKSKETEKTEEQDLNKKRTNTSYLIIREGDNNAGNQHQTIKLLKCDQKDNLNWKNITEADIAQTYTKIKSLIGEYKDITSINVVLQENVFIVNKKTDDQISEFRKYFNLDKLEKIEELIKDKNREVKAQIKSMNNTIQTLGFTDKIPKFDKVTTILTQLEEQKNKIATYIKNRLNDKDVINKKIVPTNIIKYKDLKNVKQNKQTLINNVNNLYNNILNIINSDLVIKSENKTDIDINQFDLQLLKKIINDNTEKINELYKKYLTITDINLNSNTLIENNENILVENINENVLLIKQLTQDLIIKKSKITYTYEELEQVKDTQDVILYDNNIINSLITEYETRKETLINDINNSLKNIVEIDKAFNANFDINKNKIETNVDDLLKMRKELEVKISLLSSNSNINITKLEFNNNCACCTKNKEFLTFNKNNILQQINKINDDIVKYKQCEIYKNNIDKYNNNIQIHNNILLLKEKIKHYENEITTSKNKLNSNIKKLDIIKQKNIIIDTNDLKNKINDVKAITSTMVGKYNYNIDKQIKLLKNNITQIQLYLNYINEYNNVVNTEKIFDNNTKLENKLKVLETDIQKAESALQVIDIKLKKYNVIKQHLLDYNKISGELKKLLKKNQIYNKYLEIINAKDGLPYKILKKSCYTIEKGINQILNNITDFKIYLGFDFKKANKFKIMIMENNNTKPIPAEQGSGFQKFIIDLSLRLCLAKNHPYLPNFLIVDEGFGCMDKEHLNNTKEFLNQLHLLNKFDWLIIISHIEELQNITKNNIKITSTNGKSNILLGKIPNFPDSQINNFKQLEKTVDVDPNDDKKLLCSVCNRSFLKKENAEQRHINTKLHQQKYNKHKNDQLSNEIMQTIDS